MQPKIELVTNPVCSLFQTKKSDDFFRRSVCPEFKWGPSELEIAISLLGAAYPALQLRKEDGGSRYTRYFPDVSKSNRKYIAARVLKKFILDNDALCFSPWEKSSPFARVLSKQLCDAGILCREISLHLTPARFNQRQTRIDRRTKFIVQLLGSRRWKIGPRFSSVDCPPGLVSAQTEIELNYNLENGPCSEYDMQPGDVIRLDRGTVYEAETGPDVSANMEIRIEPDSIWGERDAPHKLTGRIV